MKQLKSAKTWHFKYYLIFVSGTWRSVQYSSPVIEDSTTTLQKLEITITKVLSNMKGSRAEESDGITND